MKSQYRKSNMTNLAQNFANPNNQPLVIGEFSIRQDDEGRYCLNDLHKASGHNKKHQPSNFLRVEQTQELIAEIDQGADMSLGKKDSSSYMRSCLKTLNGVGTFVSKELVYAYAMWISAKFHLIVIRAYDAMVMQWKINDRQSISPEQQALLHEIVSRRSKGERKIYAEMWSRHNRHFNIPRYAELLAIHFPESVHYLETMELKAKATENVVKVESEYNNQNLRCLAWHMLWVHQWWKQFGDPIRKISPTMAAAVHDHFVDGAMAASSFLDETDRKQIRDKAVHYPWHLNCNERMALEYKESQK